VVRLLEREDELGLLAGAVRDAIGGSGCFVLVGGEAGIGKSSLVRELRERLGDRTTFLTGACEPLSVPVPLGPLRELVESAGGGDLIDVGTDDRLVLARRVASVLAERAPVVAVVEDIHWADPATFDLMLLLARRAPQIEAVILATFRDDEVAANPALGLLLGDLTSVAAVRRLHLRTLSVQAVRELVGSTGLDAAELVRATGGNPFLVVETVAAGGTLPASVRDAALARAGRLSRAGRELVDAAAVLGQRFDHALLDAVVGGSADAVDEALARGVLVADGTRLGFRHELIREAIETSISPPRVADFHARAMLALAGQAGVPDNARLAHHAELAGLRSEAGRYASLASAEAERVGAPLQARLQAERALRLSEDLPDPDRYELLMRYSRAANFTSTRYEDAVWGAERALAVAERLRDPLRTARALGALAWALWSFDRMVDARQAADRAVAVLEPTSDVAALARAWAAQLRIEATAFDPGAAIARAPRARELAVAAGLEDVKIDIDISLGLAQGHNGQPEAIVVLTDALREARGGSRDPDDSRLRQPHVCGRDPAPARARAEPDWRGAGVLRRGRCTDSPQRDRGVPRPEPARSRPLGRGSPGAGAQRSDLARGGSAGAGHGGADRRTSRRAQRRADARASVGRDPERRGGFPATARSGVPWSRPPGCVATSALRWNTSKRPRRHRR
jgi:AAA ATPase domain